MLPSRIDIKNITQVEENDCKYEALGFHKFSEALTIISGKWKLKLLYIIGYHETLRYGEIKRLAAPITHKMLSTQLKELEADGLVIRREYPQIPPRVEYSLSDRGYGLLPVFDELYEWIIKFNI